MVAVTFLREDLKEESKGFDVCGGVVRQTCRASFPFSPFGF